MCLIPTFVASDAIYVSSSTVRSFNPLGVRQMRSAKSWTVCTWQYGSCKLVCLIYMNLEHSGMRHPASKTTMANLGSYTFETPWNASYASKESIIRDQNGFCGPTKCSACEFLEAAGGKPSRGPAKYTPRHKNLETHCGDLWILAICNSIMEYIKL